MSVRIRTIGAPIAILIAGACLSPVFGQKVKVGYDRAVDFSRYKSYSVQRPAKDPAMPMLYAHVLGTIEQELASKGLSPAEKDGDLVLIPAGGADYGLGSFSNNADCDHCKAPLLDPADWPGSTAPPGVGGKPVPKGTVELTFVDRSTNRAVWTGWVEQKLDADTKSKSFDKAAKAIQKLLKDFPPKGR